MRRTVRTALAGVVLLAAAGAAYLAWRGTPPQAVTELLSEGGEKVLRDPMRAPEAGPRVLLIALDGLGEEALREALRSRRLPNLLRAVGAPESAGAGVFTHGYQASEVLSVLPSTTFAAWASLFTGEPPGRTGIPGNEWWDRREERFYAPAPVSVTGYEHALEVYTDDLVGGALRVPTLYERATVRAFVSLSAVHRGADLLITPDAGAFGELVTQVAEGVSDDTEISQEAYRALDEAAVEELLTSLEGRGIPRLLTVYFPGVDLYTHVAEGPLQAQQRYLAEVVDPALEKIFTAYRAAGAWDSTYVLVVSDHGHTPVERDDPHALGHGEAGEPQAVLGRAGYRVRPFRIEVDPATFDAVWAFQGAAAYLYLADRSRCPADGRRCDWSRAPRVNEDVVPAVRALWEASRTGRGLPEGALSLIVVPGAEGGPRAWNGSRLVPLGEHLETHGDPGWIALERRLRQLTEGPAGHRAGDVVVLTRTGMDRPQSERFYFSGQYHSWHGSAFAQDSHIALLLSHPGLSGEELRVRVESASGGRPSQLSVTPLVLDLLGRAGSADAPPPPDTAGAR